MGPTERMLSAGLHHGPTGKDLHAKGPGELGSDPTMLIPYAPSSVAGARHALSSDLRARGVREEIISDAILVLSEILSNTIKHATPLPESGRVRLGWVVKKHTDSERSVTLIELMVSDGGSTSRPRVMNVSNTSTGGRGLGIVDNLADEWGVTEHDDNTTTVWVHFRDHG